MRENLRQGLEVRIRGQVQGVGMRPFVLRLALREGLSGFVSNDKQGVQISAGGSKEALDRFLWAISSEAPPLARIDAVEVLPCPPPAPGSFRILESDPSGRSRAAVTVDAATCDACLEELFSPGDRRYRYPLINCTECGPRFSLITGVPYDRGHTTMAPFPMCSECLAEYQNPQDRRYHAQPICCPKCGPHLRLAGVHAVNRAKTGESSEEALEAAIDRIANGGVVCIQGLGGFHLACRADSAEAVQRVRRIKRRDAKPFAVMMRDVESARQWAEFSEAGQAALTSTYRPIVLARARQTATHLAEGVAPGTYRLGVLLPYTPIHHLLFHDPRLRERPLVMTSANIANAPMLLAPEAVVRSLEAEDQGRSVDLIVWHERAIARRVDDSIYIDADPPVPVRRARGFVPAPIELSSPPQCSPAPGAVDSAALVSEAMVSEGLAVGGDLKNTFCLVRDGEAILSAHHGDLAHLSAREAFEAEIERYLQFFDVRPQFIACDLHPDFASTRTAQRLAQALEVPLLPVQHHHAHAASLLAEHGQVGPVLTLVCDGFGYGSDQTIWGGELLLASLTGFRRMAHLAPVSALGGDRYPLEPIRPALAWMARTLGPGPAANHPVAVHLEPRESRRHQLLKLGPLRGRPSSSVGRLFDAAAAILGLARENHFEAEAAMALEDAATRGRATTAAPEIEISRGPNGAQIVDPGRLLLWLVDAPSKEVAAASFHQRLAEGFATAVVHAARETGISTAGLTGGVVLNQTFSGILTSALQAEGLEVLRHARVPPNDGGLALGQAAVALATLEAKSVSASDDVVPGPR